MTIQKIARTLRQLANDLEELDFDKRKTEPEQLELPVTTEQPAKPKTKRKTKLKSVPKTEAVSVQDLKDKLSQAAEKHGLPSVRAIVGEHKVADMSPGKRLEIVELLAALDKSNKGQNS